MSIGSFGNRDDRDDKDRRYRTLLACVMGATLLTALPIHASMVAAQVVTAQAEESAETAATLTPGVLALAQAMQIDQIIDVMRDEGLDYAKTLQEDMFPGTGNSGWIAEVEDVYDADQMQQDFTSALSGALAGNPELAVMIDFMGGPFGDRVVGLELAARRALLDPAAEDIARVAWLRLEEQDGPRAQAIQRFVAVNDLMDSNVTGAMNSNIAFYRGLMAAAPADMAMTEADILASVADQHAQIAADTADWLYPYLTLAYQSLSDTELETYTDFSDSRPGRDLNRALFAAFAVMFDRLSFDLGVAAGRRMQGQDI